MERKNHGEISMSNTHQGLKAVAILELTKGIVSLLLGLGLHHVAGDSSSSCCKICCNTCTLILPVIGQRNYCIKRGFSPISI